MTDKLPYILTEGVVATREGLYFRGASDAKMCMVPAILLDDPYDGKHGDYWLSWSDAAERLRYREGEPWSRVAYEGQHECYENGPDDELPGIAHTTLHRLAAILCDDADAFRVLHACIEEFSNG